MMTKIVELYCRTIALPTEVSLLANMNVKLITQFARPTSTARLVNLRVGRTTTRRKSRPDSEATAEVSHAEHALDLVKSPTKILDKAMICHVVRIQLGFTARRHSILISRGIVIFIGSSVVSVGEIPA